MLEGLSERCEMVDDGFATPVGMQLVHITEALFKSYYSFAFGAGEMTQQLRALRGSGFDSQQPRRI